MTKLLSTDPPPVPGPQTLRVLMFNDNWSPNVAKTVRNLRELGVTDVSYFINDFNAGKRFAPDTIMTPKRAEAWTRAMVAAGFGVHPMAWCYANAGFFEDLAQFLKTTILARKYPPVRSIILDCEADYHFDAPRTEADITAMVTQHLDPLQIPFCVSGFPVMKDSMRRTINWACRQRGALNGLGMPQAYSKLEVDPVDPKKDKQIPLKGWTPDRLPAVAYKSWKDAAGPNVAPIVDAFGAEYFGWDDDYSNAMAASLVTAGNTGARMIGIWSYGHLYDTNTNKPLGSPEATARRAAITAYTQRSTTSFRRVAYADVQREWTSYQAARDARRNAQTAQMNTPTSVPVSQTQAAAPVLSSGSSGGGMWYNFRARRWV